MTKLKVDFYMPKTIVQLESYIQQLFKSNPKNVIIRIVENFELEELTQLFDKYKQQIENYRRNKSIVILTDLFDYEQLPEFISVAPTEEEAMDVIDFEEIERDLLLEE